jgi:predicted lipoprotein with Yx(FWY)xxD motif
MKRSILILPIAPLAAAVVLAATGAAGPATAAPSAAGGGARVAVASHDVGRMLVDAQGRSLYLWKGDALNKSRCSGACAGAWPPLTTKGAPKAGAGVTARLLGTIKRSDGTRQVTYAGHPLYRFTGDSSRGQVQGQGSNAFGATWWAVKPTGQPNTRKAGSSGGY